MFGFVMRDEAQDNLLLGTDMVVLQRTKSIAAISFAGTYHSTILMTGNLAALPVPNSREEWQNVLALFRLYRPFGRSLGLDSEQLSSGSMDWDISGWKNAQMLGGS